MLRISECRVTIDSYNKSKKSIEEVTMDVLKHFFKASKLEAFIASLEDNNVSITELSECLMGAGHSDRMRTGMILRGLLSDSFIIILQDECRKYEDLCDL